MGDFAHPHLISDYFLHLTHYPNLIYYDPWFALPCVSSQATSWSSPDRLGNFARSMVFPYASLTSWPWAGMPPASADRLPGAALRLVLLPVAGHICDHADKVRLLVLAGVPFQPLPAAHRFAPTGKESPWGRCLPVRLSFNWPILR
jgi:hypothetical protein